MESELKNALLKAKEQFTEKIISEKDLEILADNCLSSKDFERITKEIYKFYKLNALNSSHLVERMIIESDDSPYSLGEWIRAMSCFYDWLDSRNSSGDFIVMLGYINCCIDSNENKLVDRDIIDLLFEMLRDFGFKGESKCR